MTTDDHQNETNQAIFDDYVRHMLKGAGVEYIDEPIEHIIETIEHGDAGPETALHLIAIAHVKFMFDRVYVPYPDEISWAGKMERLQPRLQDALALCPILLSNYQPQWLEDIRKVVREETKDHPERPPHHEFFLKPHRPLDAIEWAQLTQEGYAVDVDYVSRLRSGEALPDDFFLTSLFPPKREVIDKDWQIAQSITSSEDDTQSKDQRAWMAFCKIWSEADEWDPSSKWHRYFVSQLINNVLVSPSDTIWEDWACALDLCAWIMETSKFLDRESHELTDQETGDFGTSLNLPIHSAEHWAWEFGRVAALWPMLNQEMISNLWVDLFWGWPNGLAALSLIAPHLDASSATGEYLWLGLLSTWGNHKRDNFGRFWASEPRNHITDLSLHWLSQLGYLDGAKKLNNKEEKEEGPATELVPVEPPEVSVLPQQENSALLLGSPQQLAEAWNYLQETIDLRLHEETEKRIGERLGHLPLVLPRDAIDYLVRGEVAISRNQSRRPDRIALDYTSAVEIALEEWLPAPKGRRDWPGNSIGDWADVLRKMSEPKGKRDPLDEVVRKQFDARQAKLLTEALDTIRARNRDAHGRQGPPRPQIVREYVLGTHSRPSIFELILRFAKRIRE